jgi:opacity protein-like surface antigen
MRTVFCLMALLPALALSAWSLPCGCDPFEGMYVGAAIGPATNMASQSSNTLARFDAQMDPGDQLALVSHGDFYHVRPWGEVYTGWGMRFCNWLYLGGRFGVNFSSFHVNGPTSQSNLVILEPTTPPDFTITLSDAAHTKTWSVEYTLDFKPGIVWCDQTMLFGIIGAAFNRATLNGDSRFVYANAEGLTTNSTLRVRGRETSAGLRGGIGLEQMLTYCISLNISYVYTSYWSLEAKGRGDTQTQLGVLADGHNSRFTSRARRQVTSIGLSYYF